ncbi:MAG: class I SAM-dependent methyltransferase [Candidatus Aminicenantes bacterium]|nr:class I SAM-dependent methyltransferase [Candidatus Aminicenantes bacterium]
MRHDSIKNKSSRPRILKTVAIVLIAIASAAAGQKAKENQAEAFDKIARTILKNVYPYLAKQIKQDYGITKGVCVDAGAGGAYLSIELAKITDLEIKALDIDPEAIQIAERNIRKAGLTRKVKAVLSDIQKMPFADASVDLVISRGSFMFWKDKVKAFCEVWRILKPGGVAFIGGGTGKLLPQDEKDLIKEKMDKGELGPPQELQVSLEGMGKILREAGIGQFEISSDDTCLCGLWVEFKKPSAPAQR